MLSVLGQTELCDCSCYQILIPGNFSYLVQDRFVIGQYLIKCCKIILLYGLSTYNTWGSHVACFEKLAQNFEILNHKTKNYIKNINCLASVLGEEEDSGISIVIEHNILKGINTHIGTTQNSQSMWW